MTGRQLLISVSLSLVALLLIPAVIVPDQTVRLVLFAIVLFAAIAVLITFIFVGAGAYWHMRDDVTDLRREVKDLRRVLSRVLIAKSAERTTDSMDDALRQLLDRAS